MYKQDWRITMIKKLAIMLTTLLVSGGLLAAEFGEQRHINFANQLWTVLEKANLVGDNAMVSAAYKGMHPHGAVLDTVELSVAVDGKNQPVIIKRNYGGEGVSIDAVNANPQKWLAAITVMYRIPGYDAAANDWFWVKYLPDGALDQTPTGMKLAGQVARTPDGAGGCIGCHASAPGNDFVYLNDKY